MTGHKHKIVAIDAWVTPEGLNFDHDFDIHSGLTPADVVDKIKDATIVMSAATHVTRAAIENSSRLQLIACSGVGTDHVDKAAAREKGIVVCNVPAQNTDSVSEHAFALYYALRRSIMPLHKVAMEGTAWATGELRKSMKPPSRTNSEECLVVVGYGALGKCVARIGNALNMQVIIAERKGAALVRPGRTAFDDALKQGTVFILTAPLDNDTRDMISKSELSQMDPTSLLINVGRGGVINENDLVDALRAETIAGAATDVFETEPATRQNCPLLDETIPNLILSPHIAWYSSKTIKGTKAMVKANLEQFVAGSPQNVIV